MKILVQQVRNLINQIISPTLISQWSSAYTHSQVTGEDSIHHEHDNKTLLDSYTQANADIVDAVSKRHAHANKALLDTYNQTNADIVNAITNSHTHINKDLLDTYDQTNIDLASAVDNNHTHTNKALLDQYNQSNASIADAVDKKHEHTNLPLLETYQQTEVNLEDAVSKRHAHNNKALLDTYSQTEANLEIAVNNSHTHANKALLDSLTSAGSASKFLAEDGTYKTITATGATSGSNTQIIFNDAGEYAGDASFTFDKATSTISVFAGLFTDKLMLGTDDTYLKRDGTGNMIFKDASNPEISLAGLLSVLDYRADTVAATAGEITTNFATPFASTIVPIPIIWDVEGIGVELVSCTPTTLTVNALSPGTFHYFIIPQKS